MKRKAFFVVFAVLVAVSVFSCKNSAEEGRTRLSIHIEQGASRTIMPSPSLMEVRKYSVSGTGPDGTSFGPLLSADSEISITDLVPGNWTITAKAMNAENNELASGTGRCLITTGKNDATIVLDTIAGNGTLELDFTWTDDISDDDQIRIDITIEAGDGTIVTRNKDVPTAEHRTSVVLALKAGCHVLSVQVSDSHGKLGVGATDAVRIVSNTRSTGVVELQTSKPVVHSGTVLSIENAIGNPMNFYIDYYPKSPSKGQRVTLKACNTSLSDDIDPEDLSFQWYRDGALLQNADGFNYAVTAEQGVHRYDVIVNSRKEGTMCGASLTLSIPY